MPQTESLQGKHESTISTRRAFCSAQTNLGKMGLISFTPMSHGCLANRPCPCWLVACTLRRGAALTGSKSKRNYGADRSRCPPARLPSRIPPAWPDHQYPSSGRKTTARWKKSDKGRGRGREGVHFEGGSFENRVHHLSVRPSVRFIGHWLHRRISLGYM